MKHALLALLICACGTGRGAMNTHSSTQERFRKAVDEFYWPHFAFRPNGGIELGHHRYDGKLPDRSHEAIEDEVLRLRSSLAVFGAFAPDQLGPETRLEREVILSEIRGKLFELEDLRLPFRNPMYYAGMVDLAPYISRDYKPLFERAGSIIEVANASAAFFAEARANLAPQVPRSWLDTALLQVSGTIEFVKKDVPSAMSALGDAARARELSKALLVLTDELDGFREFLVARQHDALDANSGFALGKDAFLRMLADTQGVTVDLETLKRVAKEDLDRNLDALAQAAATLLPGKSVREVVELAAREKPTGVVTEATVQAAELLRFLQSKSVVSIPTDEVAEVRESPPFMRWNGAFLDSVGMFETKELPSFYYVSPPDPSWPEAEQQAYIPARADLMFTTVHEVWPGHFLHMLHMRRSTSRVLKSFCTYSMVEGWAHYAEEMMWNAGFGAGDPRIHLGQLKEALLRNVRFLVAIGLHAESMTVEEATRMFAEKAFADPATARQQAIRGTFDPMYLSYTLGKLMIQKLWVDWQRAAGESLREFHDRLLSFGCAPLPAIRRAMLGDEAGAVL